MVGEKFVGRAPPRADRSHLSSTDWGLEAPEAPFPYTIFSPMAQVKVFFGAGVENGWGPAPRIGLLRAPVEQVPIKNPTCAKNKVHLLQGARNVRL